MSHRLRKSRVILVAGLALAVSACATTYTGPVEVTRFVSDQSTALGQGEIALTIPDEIKNQNVRIAFTEAVISELIKLGYTPIVGSAEGMQTATLRTSRAPIAGDNPRSPVSVGVGGSTGSYGSGVGLGLGINLGGGNSGPQVLTNLEVRISDPSGQALWEGRAQLPTSVKSPFSEPQASAKALASALFSDFPGGNGETVQIDVDDL